jgi:alpha-L-arabinofuranosidase
VIAPIAAEPHGPAWRKTTFFPFATTARLARGVALEVGIDGPSYETAEYGEVPLLDAVATVDPATRRTALFLVNRSQTEEAEVSAGLGALGVTSVEEAVTLSDPDPHAANTTEAHDRIGLRPSAAATVSDSTLRVVLPPVSWTAVSLR